MSEGQNTGHGHVWPRPDGMRARCGGPAMCSVCARDLAQSLKHPASAVSVAPAHGCICPPGAEATCKGALCPRRAIGSPS